MMKSSPSTYYTSDDDGGDEDDYSDYGTGTLAPSPESFESEKIVKKSSDIKKLNLSNESSVHDEISNNKPNSTQPLYVPIPSSTISTTTNLEIENNDSSNDRTNKFPKLLFSSPSATVTSNGPSVRFFALFITV